MSMRSIRDQDIAEAEKRAEHADWRGAPRFEVPYEAVEQIARTIAAITFTPEQRRAA